MSAFFSVSSCINPETQMVSAVRSHSSSVKTEATQIENVYTDDSHEQSTATQKSRMDQQMSTALHGMPSSVTKQEPAVVDNQCVILNYYYVIKEATSSS